MPGGKRRLTQLFVGRTKTGGDGTEVTQLLAGSATFATAGCAGTILNNACAVAEVTITDLNACDILVGNVHGLSACWVFEDVIAGDGQASIVYRFAACPISGSVDARATGGTLRYIAIGLPA